MNAEGIANKLVEQLLLEFREVKCFCSRGGVEDTRLEAKVKDTKNFEAKDRPSRGQGPRTQTQVFSKKKRSSKFFFRRFLLEETKKKVFADFPQGFWRFPTKFQQFKNSAILEPRTGQFSRPKPRHSKCVLEAKDVLEDSTSVS